MSGSIDMNVGVFWETSVGFLKNVVWNFSQNIAKVMLIWMSEVVQDFKPLKNRQVVLVFSI